MFSFVQINKFTTKSYWQRTVVDINARRDRKTPRWLIIISALMIRKMKKNTGRQINRVFSFVKMLNSDDQIQEGFLCPECHRDMSNMEMLQNHYQTVHLRTSTSLTSSFKGNHFFAAIRSIVQNGSISQVFSRWLNRNSLWQLINKIFDQSRFHNPTPSGMQEVMIIVFNNFEKIESTNTHQKRIDFSIDSINWL